VEVGDGTRAGEAHALLRRGAVLVYRGDYHNARQLLAAVRRRLVAPRRGPSPRAVWEAERELRRLEHALLGRLLVPAGPGWRLPLGRAPDVADALSEAFGPPPAGPAVLPLRDVLGAVGAHEWRRRGVAVAALGGDAVHPWYGVYAPVRQDPVDLVAGACDAWPVAGKRVLDAGTGTGVLAVLLARRGAEVVATDLSPEAVGCARDNVTRLGVGERVRVVQADLFPEQPGAPLDLAVSNPPWIPGTPHGVLDRAIFDPGGAFLARLVAGLPGRLAPGGEAWIVRSDLAERLGLEPPGRLESLAREAGLEVADVLEARPVHPRSRDRGDPLHAVRSREVTRLHRLVRA
jgi:SAM-dependent methyltransferase